VSDWDEPYTWGSWRSHLTDRQYCHLLLLRCYLLDHPDLKEAPASTPTPEPAPVEPVPAPLADWDWG
jgi:hypothetical protein